MVFVRRNTIIELTSPKEFVKYCQMIARSTSKSGSAFRIKRESGLRFRKKKDGGLQNVQPPIDPLYTLSYLSS